MLRLTLALALATTVTPSTGCVTSATLARKGDVSLPLLGGAVGADLALVSLAAFQVDDFTAGAAIGTALAITALDLGIGCLLGGCAALRP